MGAHRKRVEVRTNVRSGVSGGTAEFVHRAMQIVDHEPHVSVHVPVQPDRVDVLRSASDAVGIRDRNTRCEEIVQIDITVASSDFPGAPATR